MRLRGKEVDETSAAKLIDRVLGGDDMRTAINGVMAELEQGLKEGKIDYSKLTDDQLEVAIEKYFEESTQYDDSEDSK